MLKLNLAYAMNYYLICGINVWITCPRKELKHWLKNKTLPNLDFIDIKTCVVVLSKTNQTQS